MDIVVMMMKFKYLNGREDWEYMETLNITSSKALFGFTTYGSAATAGFSGMSTASMGRELPPHTFWSPCLLRWSCTSYKPIRRLGSFLRHHHFQFGLAPRQSCTSLSGTVELKTWPSSSAANSENEL